MTSLRWSTDFFKKLLHLTSECWPSQRGQGWYDFSLAIFDSMGKPPVARDVPLASSTPLLFGLIFRPNLGWFTVTVLFLSFFSASGEKIGSFSNSASSLTNFTKSLKVIIFFVFVCASWACLHHLTPE